MQDRQEEIQEVRPTEETLKTDEDKEGNGKRDQEGNQNQNQKKSQKDSQDEIQLGEDGTIQHLNISV